MPRRRAEVHPGRPRGAGGANIDFPSPAGRATKSVAFGPFAGHRRGLLDFERIPGKRATVRWGRTREAPGRGGDVWRWVISAKLFVGSLNFQTTREQLLELFAGAGQVVDVVLPTDRDSGKPRGFAFVEYATPAEAQEAIRRFNGYELDGRALRVNEAEARPPRPRNFAPDFGGDRQGGGGFGNPFGGGKPFKAKGSRRHLRARKRGG
ncbi:MAG: hypothetical protein HY907_17355 [Deltaproteobacteria bacterium]|nr:hypothetical protein [Deltaproteobacteria bacterium]